MPSKNQQKGEEGERRAAAYLQEHGYAVLARNYRFRRVEIDLVCMEVDAGDSRRGTLVFVEVKSRTSDLFGSPESAVTWPKQKNIILAARAYVFQNHMEGFPCRFDVITVKTSRTGSEIRHFKDAFHLS